METGARIINNKDKNNSFKFNLPLSISNTGWSFLLLSCSRLLYRPILLYRTVLHEGWSMWFWHGCWLCLMMFSIHFSWNAAFPFRNTITKVWILQFLHAVGLSRCYFRFLEADDNTRNKNNRTKTCILLTDTGVVDRGARHRVLSAWTSAFFILWYFFNMLLYNVLVSPVSPSLQSPAKLSAGNIMRSKF